MIVLRLILFCLIVCSQVLAQSNELVKFRIEKKSPDGQTFFYEGMTNTSGKIIIPADYDFIWDFKSDSLTLARKRFWDYSLNSTNFSYQVISSNGFLYYEFPPYLIPEPLSGGVFRTYNSQTRLFGYVSEFGEKLTKFKYPEALDFSENLAAVKDPKSKLYGYINKRGKFAIKPEFSDAHSFKEGLAVVKYYGRYVYLQSDGKQIPIENNYDKVYNLQEGFSIVTKDSLFGFINKVGKEIVAPKFGFIDNFEEGTAAFVKEKFVGMLNTAGSIVIEPRYDELFRFDQNHYLFQQNGLNGLIDLKGAVIVSANYSAIGYFQEGIAPVLRTGKWGFIDTQGNEFIPCQFSEYQTGYVDGKVNVRLADQWQLARLSDTLNLPAYDEILPFYGLTAAFRKENLWGFLNVQGEECIEPRFDELVYNKGGVIFGRTSEKNGSFRWSVINRLGKETNSGMFTEVVRYSEGFSAVKTEQGWGFINENGAAITPFIFSAVRNFSEGYAAVYLNKQWGFIGKDGKYILPPFAETEEFKKVLSGAVNLNDSLKLIRNLFPLFNMQVVGDFNNNEVCVADEAIADDNTGNRVMDKQGKIVSGKTCIPYIQQADSFNPLLELNPNYTVITSTGRWVTLDNTGKIIN
jgi:hypothetical protein